jgi:hypothetical protein
MIIFAYMLDTCVEADSATSLQYDELACYGESPTHRCTPNPRAAANKASVDMQRNGHEAVIAQLGQPSYERAINQISASGDFELYKQIFATTAAAYQPSL